MTDNCRKKTGLFRRFPWKPLRFVQLFLFIIVIMLLSPVLQQTPFLTALLSIFFLNILLVTLSFSGFDIRYRWPLIILWFAGNIMKVASLRNPDRLPGKVLEIAAEMVISILIAVCVVMILRYVLTSYEVTVDTIFGAIVAYFLIAFTFSTIYQAVAIIEPASFSMPSSTEFADNNTRNIEFNYFSFVTIATLGYGDIVPRSPVARILSILEAAIGQFYMAVVVAWLVSAHAGRTSPGEKRSRHGG